MSVAYRAVGWNRQKRIYDAVLLAGVALYLAIFVGAGSVVRPQATIETLLIRALGTAAFLMLHVVLSIGPLCRLHPRLLPLLYNRRHLGVATVFVLGQRRFGSGVFEFGVGREFAGVVRETPYPTLHVPRPGRTDGRCGCAARSNCSPAPMRTTSPRSHCRSRRTSASGRWPARSWTASASSE